MDFLPPLDKLGDEKWHWLVGGAILAFLLWLLRGALRRRY